MPKRNKNMPTLNMVINDQVSFLHDSLKAETAQAPPADERAEEMQAI